MVSGPGLKAATAKRQTHVLVVLRHSDGRPISIQQKVTAKLEPVTQNVPQAAPVVPARTNKWRWSKKIDPLPQSTLQKPSVAVSMKSSSQHEVFFTAVSRGQHRLCIQVNEREIKGSPFTLTVYPDPTQLGHPVRTVSDLNRPYGIAYNSRGEMIVSESHKNTLSIFDSRGTKMRNFNNVAVQMVLPKGTAIDEADNVYVSSLHKLQKFTSTGGLIRFVGKDMEGRKEGELNDPRSVTNRVYVCDRNNHRIQVFDLDLKFVQSIGSPGRGKCEFGAPVDVEFDTAGNMYVAEFSNKRVQVLSSSGHFVQTFGEGKLHGPSSLHIADKNVYVSDLSSDCIVVYETTGQLVTSFARHGDQVGELSYPVCITSCVDGFIHVCDQLNNRIQYSRS